ncbi:MAG: squalene cyclase, partial [Acidimicrobiia bacterium]|nr:squalene cyclase [Acidimicrobiia bacterium]
ATTWTLNALRTFGLDPAALTDTATRLDANSRWEYDDLPYWGGEVDCCINAFTLANGAWLGVDTSPLLDWFDDHRMDDGGWDCEWENGSTRSSFHSTLNTLMGLADYQRITGESTKELRRAAEEYLLSRDLYKRRSTGEPVADWVFVLAYPFRWRYSILHAGVYFRAAGQLDGAAPDPRMAEAMEWVRDQRQPDGTWIQGHRFPGRVWFDIDVPPGEPSKWLTYSAMGVLAWWDGDSAA